MNSFRQITLRFIVLAALRLPTAHAATNVVAAVQPGSLAFHLATNAASHAAQLLGSREEMVEIHAPLAWFGPVWSHNFWLKGVRGLSATCIGSTNHPGSGQGLVTMVSPRHYLCATHMHPEDNMLVFLGADNSVNFRRTWQRVDVGGDTSVGLLDAELPPAVGFLPVLPDNFTNYLPTDFSTFVQGIGMNQDLCLFSEPMNFAQPSRVCWSVLRSAAAGLGTNWNVPLRGGDSSNPVLLLVGNQLVLVSHNEIASGGPSYAAQIPAINRAMHLLSTNNQLKSDYQLTPFPLTHWPVFQ